MSNPNLQTLTESKRFAYLQAMEVPLWQNRNELRAIECDNQEKKNNQQEKSIEKKNQTIEKTVEKVVSEKLNTVEREKIEKTSVKKETSKNPTTEKNSRFLKMVSWHSGIQSSSSILIICRHDSEQPANSFAKPHAPSQFMTDYINALVEFLGENNKDCYIRLGHLSQAGLGKDCQSLSQTIEELTPKVVLMLGEETIKELSEPQNDIASLRGKIFSVDEHKHCIASYHPFTLINNPHLKSLAMEDLKMLAKFLIQEK